MDQNSDQMLQTTTHHLGKLLNDVIAESPRVAQALQTLKADGYDVLMRVEVSLAFQKIKPDHVKHSPSEVGGLSEARSARAF